MKLEDWNTILQFASAALLALTFGVGAGTVITGYVLGKRQNERIAATERATAEANQGAAEALGKAGAANERANKLELEADQQRERAAKAEHDLLELQQRLAWRRISPREHHAIVASLKLFAGSIVEITKLGESEAGQFAEDIISVFIEAGWKVQRNFSGVVSPPMYGLQCLINEGTPAGKAIKTVVRTLPTAHIESAPDLPIVARVFVGLRPPP